MKFKTIALAALAAVAAPSFAAVQVGGEIGDAEYVFVATNSAGSYFQDLGATTGFIAGNYGKTFTQSVAGAEWNKFLAFGGTNTTWAIIAAQPLGDGFNPGEINAWTTRNVNQALGTIQNSQSNDGTSNLAVSFLTADAKSSPKVADNRLASAFGTSAYFDNGTLSFNGFFNARNAVGTQASMVYLTPSNEVSDLPSLFTVLNSTASFNGSTVTITTAVPEPSTYAMLFAGLAAVGFMARRRKA
ncbi:PEP-CTERM sorting domain-containing protein [Roseateles sp. DXS20W]|uniref:PEP-CTERM sorting domain-containing protein n=1 Tax=Pelomonas lactea TaxID=3299030 RepID=A0ABW7GDU1_9BURK